MDAAEQLRNEDPNKAERLVAVIMDSMIQAAHEGDGSFVRGEVDFAFQYPFLQAIATYYDTQAPDIQAKGVSDEEVRLIRSGIYLACTIAAGYLSSRTPDRIE